MIYVYQTADRDTEKAFDEAKNNAKKGKPSSKPTLTSETAVQVNGLSGREFIYHKEKVVSRALLVFADHRIYAVEFYTEDKKGLDRGPVNRVFNSFQPKP